MKKVRILVNTRLNRVFYGRDSVVDVSTKDAEHLESLGLAEILYINQLDETPEEAKEVEKVEEIKQPEAEEKPKAKAKKAVKK